MVVRLPWVPPKVDFMALTIIKFKKKNLKSYNKMLKIKQIKMQLIK